MHPEGRTPLVMFWQGTRLPWLVLEMQRLHTLCCCAHTVPIYVGRVRPGGTRRLEGLAPQVTRTFSECLDKTPDHGNSRPDRAPPRPALLRSRSKYTPPSPVPETPLNPKAAMSSAPIDAMFHDPARRVSCPALILAPLARSYFTIFSMMATHVMATDGTVPSSPKTP